MNKDNFFNNLPLFSADWTLLIKVLLVILVLVLFAMFIYDRFIQRKNQLLINYPLIGRMRYFFTFYVTLCVSILETKLTMILLKR